LVRELRKTPEGPIADLLPVALEHAWRDGLCDAVRSGLERQLARGKKPEALVAAQGEQREPRVGSRQGKPTDTPRPVGSLLFNTEVWSTPQPNGP
jgi:hypothetical protein